MFKKIWFILLFILLLPGISFAQYYGLSTEYKLKDGSGTFTKVTLPNGGTIGTDSYKWLFDETNGDISTTAKVGIGTTAATQLLDIDTSNIGGANIARICNSDNTDSGSNAQVNIVTGGSSGGDPLLVWNVTGEQSWRTGIDNTDSNKWKLSAGAILAGNEIITAQVNGNIGFQEADPETTIELSHATPYIQTNNTETEDTDYGRESRWIAKGHQTGAEQTTLGLLEFAHDGTSDDQKGIFTLKLNDGTDGDTPTAVMTALANGNVGIGTVAPVGKLDVTGHIVLYQAGDEGANRPTPSDTDPHVRAYSADAAEADDYIEMFHDQTNSWLVSGNGELSLLAVDTIALGATGSSGALSYNVNTGGSVLKQRWDIDTDQYVFGVSDSIGNQFIVSNNDNVAKDHDHALQTNPTLYIHSDLDPNVSNNHWGSLHHDQTNFVITTGANIGEGSAPDTIENAIVFSPRGAEKMRIEGGGNVGIGVTDPDTTLEVFNGGTQLKLSFDGTDNTTFAVDTSGDLTITPSGTKLYTTDVIRGTTSLWYSPPQHVEMSSANPGGSGATWIPATATVLQGWQLNADAETLTFEGDVHDDWDEATDIEIKLIFESNVNNTAGDDADTTDFNVVCYYKGQGEKTNKTQTVTHPCVVGKIDDHEQFNCTALINYDEASNVVEAGDKFSFILNLVTGTSEVADITLNHVHVRYKTNQLGAEV